MNEVPPPLLLIPSFKPPEEGTSAVMLRGFISSLLRSLFGGRIVVFRNHEIPLFKVERKALDEVFAPAAIAERSEAAGRQATREILFGIWRHLKPESRQWVIVAEAGFVEFARRRERLGTLTITASHPVAGEG